MRTLNILRHLLYYTSYGCAILGPRGKQARRGEETREAREKAMARAEDEEQG